MSFGKVFGSLGLVGLAGLLAVAPGGPLGAPAYAAELKQNPAAAVPLVVTSLAKAVPSREPVSAGAALVGNMLAPKPLDPDVPLPQPDLAANGPRARSLGGPRIFGRQEDGGGVLGLRIPFPVDRGAIDRHTRYSDGLTGPEGR